MKLNVKAFPTSRDLMKYVNEMEIEQERIVQIVHSDQVYLYYFAQLVF